MKAILMTLPSFNMENTMGKKIPSHTECIALIKEFLKEGHSQNSLCTDGGPSWQSISNAVKGESKLRSQTIQKAIRKMTQLGFLSKGEPPSKRTKKVVRKAQSIPVQTVDCGSCGTIQLMLDILTEEQKDTLILKRFGREKN